MAPESERKGAAMRPRALLSRPLKVPPGCFLSFGLTAVHCWLLTFGQERVPSSTQLPEELRRPSTPVHSLIDQAFFEFTYRGG